MKLLVLPRLPIQKCWSHLPKSFSDVDSWSPHPILFSFLASDLVLCFVLCDFGRQFPSVAMSLIDCLENLLVFARAVPLH